MRIREAPGKRGKSILRALLSARTGSLESPELENCSQSTDKDPLQGQTTYSSGM